MGKFLRFTRPFKRARSSGEANTEFVDIRPILPPVDYDPMSARTFVTHFDLGRIF